TGPGAYTFHLKGNIKGQAVDESITAGDKTFNLVTAASDAQWPNQLPSNADLATKLDRLSTRQDSSLSSADSAQTAATRGLIVAILAVALAIGAVGTTVVLRRTR